MGSIGMGELILIFLAVLLIFGAKRIPEIAKGLGHGIREFKNATREVSRELTVEEERRSYVRPADNPTVSRTPALATTPEPVAAPPSPQDASI